MPNMIEIKNFEEVKNKCEEYYKTLTPVQCPYFQKQIGFNSQGLEHLKFKNHTRPRNPRDQYLRFRLIHLAPQILKLSRTVQGILKTKEFERMRVHSRTENILTHISYFEFIAILEDVRVKVIVKQIADGELFFWSIIPFWGTNEITKEKYLHSGNPETD